MAIEGDLQEISMASLVQMICFEQVKAMLVLRRQREEGALFFDDGEIVHATAASTVGSLTGEEAAYYLLSWTNGDFRVRNHIKLPPRTINVPLGHLLLEAMNRIDEQSARNAEQAQGAKTLSPAEIEQDSALEDNLILLLSSLEHSRAQLADKKSKKRPVLALQILTEMVNHIIIFSQEQLDEISLARALGMAGDVYPRARLLHAQDNQLSAPTVSNLYNSWSSDPAGRQETFQQIAHGMTDVLRTSLSFFINRFRSPSTAGQWKETCNNFLADLTRAINQIRF